MKNYITIILFLVSTQVVLAQIRYEPQGLKLKEKQENEDLRFEFSSVTIKDNEGKTIDLIKLSQMTQSEKYDMDIYEDNEGNIKELVLRLKYDVELNKPGGQGHENPLTKELEKIWMRDQMLRAFIVPDGCITKAYDKDSYQYQYFISLMIQEDKKNREQVCQIIDEHGWLGVSEVGQLANSALFLVIQHSPLETLEKYFPLLKESAVNGESKMTDMALMYDRIQMYKKEKQVFGSQTAEVNGKLYIIPIEDPAKVDIRRERVGLQALAEYLKYLGLNYPEDEMPLELYKK
ncbi:MAG: hypothetical protein LBL90_05620 [Prevotellaceae bacterium]|jgi:hypothetical protein|nr:hypothetical protein [Prevotellaceae bacterium]